MFAMLVHFPDPRPPSRAPLKLGLPPANCSELNDALRMSAEKVVRVTVTLLKVAPRREPWNVEPLRSEPLKS